MATVNLNLSFDSNEINISILSEEMIAFNKKWAKIVELFKGELFVEDGEGYLWLLASPDEELFISTSDYGRGEEGPNKSRAVFKLLSRITNAVGDCDFGFGESPFEEEFYTDLFKLSQIDNGPGGYSFCATVTINGYAGYYSGAYEFLPEGGIEATFTFYNEDEEEEEED
jgi:hypothetical protein